MMDTTNTIDEVSLIMKELLPAQPANSESTENASPYPQTKRLTLELLKLAKTKAALWSTFNPEKSGGLL